MAKGLFASPKKALLFVAMTLLSVVMLVGTEKEQGALVQATSGIADAPEPEFAPRRDIDIGHARNRKPNWDDTEISGFSADEDLIDTTEGFDPSPRADADEIESRYASPETGEESENL